MAQPYTPIRRSAYNAWLPQTNFIHDKVVLELISEADKVYTIDPAVIAFDEAVTQDQKELFASALTQVGEYYEKWADESSIVKDWDGFLKLLNYIIQSPPPFHKTMIDGVTIGEPIGVPLYLILDLVSNTTAAYTLFTDKKFNEALKDLLNSWGEYLKTEPSAGTLDDNGWFSPQGLAVLEAGLGGLTFEQTYKIDNPEGPIKYNSWDRFFTREFINQDVRPVQPASGGRVFVNNACESTVLRFATNVQVHDTFWLKEQNYSIYDMLGGTQDGSLAPEYAEKFKGGSVYQAFLSPQDYHRFHSPVTGEIVASQKFDGTYYAALPDNGAPPYDSDLVPGDPHGALIRSQPWLSVAATRAVYIIQPDPALHLEWVAFIAIGMVEVSTCEITKPSGAVNAGDEIGLFHFGGSSHTLLLKPMDGYKVVFQDFYETPIRPGQHRWINSGIAQVREIGIGEAGKLLVQGELEPAVVEAEL